MVSCRDKEVDVQKWKRLALQSQKGLRDTQHAERQAQRAAHQVAADYTQLQDRVVQLEHELRAKVQSNKLPCEITYMCHKSL